MRLRLVIWITALAVLSVGARNFEPGLSLDGPIYATIARHIHETGDAFRLDAEIPDFAPFIEHPHLGFWIFAGVLHFLPAQDWALRLPNHVFYVGFLVFFYLLIEAVAWPRVAIAAVLGLWVLPGFSNAFSNTLLDPAVAFFGIFALWCLSQRGIARSFAAGLSLGLAALVKGPTIVGFAPAALYLIWTSAPRAAARVRACAPLLIGGILVLLSYAWLLRQHGQADFLAQYYQKQFTHRLNGNWNSSLLFGSEYWRALWHQASYLLVLALAGLFVAWRQRGAWLALILFVSYVSLYAPVARTGLQYWVLVLPWVSWMAAYLLSFIPKLERATLVSGVFALVAVAVIQYLPYPTHRGGPSEAMQDIAKFSTGSLVWLDAYPQSQDFTFASRVAWYGHRRVFYRSSNSEPMPHQPSDLWLQTQSLGFDAQHWCLYKRYADGERLLLAASNPDCAQPAH